MSTLSTISIGRITSALPNALVLDSETPSKPDQSRVVIKTSAGGNLQSFYFCVKNSSDRKTGFLATYDLKYVLLVSHDMEHGGRVIRYIRAKDTIAHGGPWPSWVTNDMMFKTESRPSDLVRFTSLISASKPLVMDVAEMVDKEGTVIIAYPLKDGDHKNQLFKLEKPLPLH